MSSLAEQSTYISVADYLAGERESEVKHEYVDGQVYAMAGASIRHNLITGNMYGMLWNHLRGSPCYPLTSDMLLKTTNNHYRYPDLMVVCDDDPSDDEYVRENPTLIVEVLSKSTRRKDKTEKRAEYLSLPNLLEYVLIEQDYAEIGAQRRSNNWQTEYFYPGQEFTLESVDVTLNVADVYERVENDDMAAYLLLLQEAAEAKS